MTELGEQILGPDGTGVVELLETLGEAITIRDPYDRIVYANRAALAQMGFDTLEELLSRPLGSIMDEYVVRDDQGRPLEMSDVPSVRLMKGEPVEPLLMHTIKRDTGESHWQLLKAAALRDPEGNMLAAITVIEDVTAVKTAEVYTSVLAESGRILASSLDYEQTLRNVAEAAVPAVADWCVVDLIDEDLRRQHVVTAHRDPAMRELAKRARQFEPEVLDREQRLAQVYLTGISELYAHITDEQLVAGARDAEHTNEILAALIRRAAVDDLADGVVGQAAVERVACAHWLSSLKVAPDVGEHGEGKVFQSWMLVAPRVVYPLGVDAAAEDLCAALAEFRIELSEADDFCRA